jgi:photosystem II stability/assembly factor-like uncharacterized protein
LKNISFVGDSGVIVVGSMGHSGIILQSSTNDTTFQYATERYLAYNQRYLTNDSFDDSNGIAVGYNGLILHSNDSSVGEGQNLL